MTLRVLIPLLLSLCIGTAHSETLTGHPRVVDADTLAFDLERVRIEGIDAPEAKQTCRDAAGKEYPCGEVATEALRARINSNVVMCKGDSRDRYGRLICVRFFADGNNLNGGVVHHALVHPVPARKTDLPGSVLNSVYLVWPIGGSDTVTR